MGPAYFVIAILGCADGGADCRTVAAPVAHYATEQACLAARTDALIAHNDLDFPSLVAQCLPVSRKASTAQPEPAAGGAVAA